MKYTRDDKLWADILEVALALKVPHNTISQWQTRGFVPPSGHYDLIVAAERMGIKLTHKKLHLQWKSCQRLKKTINTYKQE